MRLLFGILAVATAMVATTVEAQKAFLPSIGGGDVVMPVISIRQIRLAGTLLQQYDFSCGSAAIATLLTHQYGYAMREATVFEYLFRNGDQKKIRTEGFSLLDMKRFLQAHGFEADGSEQSLDKLTEARVPAVVLINENGYQHFVIVKGLSVDRVLIGDPASGTRALSRASFMASWKSGLLFVVHNRMNSARFNLAADWQAVPQAPLRAGVNRDSLSGATTPKHGPGDF